MMLLLDTHAFLWFCQNSSNLSSNARALIEDAGNRKFLSLASCWEIAIKAGLGKLSLGESCDTYIPNALSRSGVELLPISLSHVTGIEHLPAQHRDPFDRLLVAQSLTDGLALISCDEIFDLYGVERLW